jgi:hypothetical protein
MTSGKVVGSREARYTRANLLQFAPFSALDRLPAAFHVADFAGSSHFPAGADKPE